MEPAKPGHVSVYQRLCSEADTMLPALPSDEDGERGPRSIALFWSEDPPGRMLRIDQFGACTHPSPALWRHPGGYVEWFLDEGEQERAETPAEQGFRVVAPTRFELALPA